MCSCNCRNRTSHPHSRIGSLHVRTVMYGSTAKGLCCGQTLVIPEYTGEIDSSTNNVPWSSHVACIHADVVLRSAAASKRASNSTARSVSRKTLGHGMHAGNSWTASATLMPCHSTHNHPRRSCTPHCCLLRNEGFCCRPYMGSGSVATRLGIKASSADTNVHNQPAHFGSYGRRAATCGVTFGDAVRPRMQCYNYSLCEDGCICYNCSLLVSENWRGWLDRV